MVIRYKPRTLKDLVGNNAPITKLRTWLQDWEKVGRNCILSFLPFFVGIFFPQCRLGKSQLPSRAAHRLVESFVFFLYDILLLF